jgi:hypothetical protein
VVQIRHTERVEPRAMPASFDKYNYFFTYYFLSKMSDYNSRGNRELKRGGSDGKSHNRHSLEPSYKRQLTERTPTGERVCQNESNSTPLSHRPERSGIGVDVDEWEVWYFISIYVSFLK